MAYEIAFAHNAIGHLAALTARERSLVLSAIEKQLSHEPAVETRNRKLLRPNPLASWELRVGVLRIFYDIVTTRVTPDAAAIVRILAVGKKERDVLRIGGERVEL